LIDKDLERLAGILNQYNIRQRQAVAGVLRNEEYLKESVANISHDLRTPLTVILGHLQLLQKENWESSQAQRVKVIFSKAEKMKELVETFYDLSILEEQQTVPEKEKFNISNMLINLITENAVALEKENILPEINLPDYSIYVYSDKNMVERILQNLLTNAIKYSVGTIKITLMEKENNNIIFTIENPMSDSSEIDCNRLFDRFYTGDKSRHNGSTGLGLAVVKTLVAILGGNIVAKVHANSLIITLEL
jgi:signal transduction histidine kinase